MADLNSSGRERNVEPVEISRLSMMGIRFSSILELLLKARWIHQYTRGCQISATYNLCIPDNFTLAGTSTVDLVDSSVPVIVIAIRRIRLFTAELTTTTSEPWTTTGSTPDPSAYR